jgi:hypothetical protein
MPRVKDILGDDAAILSLFDFSDSSKPRIPNMVHPLGRLSVVGLY